MWIDGQQMIYKNWGADQPRNFPGKDAVLMLQDGTWGNEYSSQEFSFICEEDTKPTCNGGYSLYGSNCYIYRQEKLGFRDAQKNCSDDGGNLASVHSRDEDDFLQSLIGDEFAWIGGNRNPGNKGEWQWTDQTPFDYTQWASTQPSPIPDNRCIVMNYPDEHRTGWSNEVCDISYGYICEKPTTKA